MFMVLRSSKVRGLKRFPLLHTILRYSKMYSTGPSLFRKGCHAAGEGPGRSTTKRNRALTVPYRVWVPSPKNTFLNAGGITARGKPPTVQDGSYLRG